MKKQLASNGQKGFVFPYIVFLSTLLFIITTSGIAIYKSHIEISQMEAEQIKLETLIQMATSEFKKNLGTNGPLLPAQKLQYTYPYGIVTITCLTKDSNKSTLEYVAHTDKGGIRSFVATVSQ